MDCADADGGHDLVSGLADCAGTGGRAATTDRSARTSGTDPAGAGFGRFPFGDGTGSSIVTAEAVYRARAATGSRPGAGLGSRGDCRSACRALAIAAGSQAHGNQLLDSSFGTADCPMGHLFVCAVV